MSSSFPLCSSTPLSPSHSPNFHRSRPRFDSALYLGRDRVLSFGPAGRGGRSLAVLDASVVNVYQGASAVIFMVDPYRPETLEKVGSCGGGRWCLGPSVRCRVFSENEKIRCFFELYLAHQARGALEDNVTQPIGPSLHHLSALDS